MEGLREQCAGKEFIIGYWFREYSTTSHQDQWNSQVGSLSSYGKSKSAIQRSASRFSKGMQEALWSSTSDEAVLNEEIQDKLR